jgi:NADH:ubiquinone oxidoreductase subunit 6 (subunit J)
MEQTVDILVFVALAIVLLVLVAGIVNLLFSGEKARSRSNQLMRLRVIAQFVAVVLLMIGFWVKSQSAGG